MVVYGQSKPVTTKSVVEPNSSPNPDSTPYASMSPDYGRYPPRPRLQQLLQQQEEESRSSIESISSIHSAARRPVKTLSFRSSSTVSTPKTSQIPPLTNSSGVNAYGVSLGGVGEVPYTTTYYQVRGKTPPGQQNFPDYYFTSLRAAQTFASYLSGLGVQNVSVKTFHQTEAEIASQNSQNQLQSQEAQKLLNSEGGKYISVKNGNTTENIPVPDSVANNPTLLSELTSLVKQNPTSIRFQTNAPGTSPSYTTQYGVSFQGKNYYFDTLSEANSFKNTLIDSFSLTPSSSNSLATIQNTEFSSVSGFNFANPNVAQLVSKQVTLQNLSRDISYNNVPFQGRGGSSGSNPFSSRPWTLTLPNGSKMSFLTKQDATNFLDNMISGKSNNFYQINGTDYTPSEALSLLQNNIPMSGLYSFKLGTNNYYYNNGNPISENEFNQIESGSEYFSNLTNYGLKQVTVSDIFNNIPKSSSYWSSNKSLYNYLLQLPSNSIVDLSSKNGSLSFSQDPAQVQAEQNILQLQVQNVLNNSSGLSTSQLISELETLNGVTSVTQNASGLVVSSQYGDINVSFGSSSPSPPNPLTSWIPSWVPSWLKPNVSLNGPLPSLWSGPYDKRITNDLTNSTDLGFSKYNQFTTNMQNFYVKEGEQSISKPPSLLGFGEFLGSEIGVFGANVLNPTLSFTHPAPSYWLPSQVLAGAADIYIGGGLIGGAGKLAGISFLSKITGPSLLSAGVKMGLGFAGANAIITEAENLPQVRGLASDIGFGSSLEYKATLPNGQTITGPQSYVQSQIDAYNASNPNNQFNGKPQYVGQTLNPTSLLESYNLGQDIGAGVELGASALGAAGVPSWLASKAIESPVFGVMNYLESRGNPYATALGFGLPFVGDITRVFGGDNVVETPFSTFWNSVEKVNFPSESDDVAPQMKWVPIPKPNPVIQALSNYVSDSQFANSIRLGNYVFDRTSFAFNNWLDNFSTTSSDVLGQAVHPLISFGRTIKSFGPNFDYSSLQMENGIESDWLNTTDNWNALTRMFNGTPLTEKLGTSFSDFFGQAVHPLVSAGRVVKGFGPNFDYSSLQTEGGIESDWLNTTNNWNAMSRMFNGIPWYEKLPTTISDFVGQTVHPLVSAGRVVKGFGPNFDYGSLNLENGIEATTARSISEWNSLNQMFNGVPWYENFGTSLNDVIGTIEHPLISFGRTIKSFGPNFDYGSLKMENGIEAGTSRSISDWGALSRMFEGPPLKEMLPMYMKDIFGLTYTRVGDFFGRGFEYPGYDVIQQQTAESMAWARLFNGPSLLWETVPNSLRDFTSLAGERIGSTISAAKDTFGNYGRSFLNDIIEVHTGYRPFEEDPFVRSLLNTQNRINVMTSLDQIWNDQFKGLSEENLYNRLTGETYTTDEPVNITSQEPFKPFEWRTFEEPTTSEGENVGGGEEKYVTKQIAEQKAVEEEAQAEADSQEQEQSPETEQVQEQQQSPVLRFKQRSLTEPVYSYWTLSEEQQARAPAFLQGSALEFLPVQVQNQIVNTKQREELLQKVGLVSLQQYQLKTEQGVLQVPGQDVLQDILQTPATTVNQVPLQVPQQTPQQTQTLSEMLGWPTWQQSEESLKPPLPLDIPFPGPNPSVRPFRKRHPINYGSTVVSHGIKTDPFFSELAAPASSPSAPTSNTLSNLKPLPSSVNKYSTVDVVESSAPEPMPTWSSPRVAPALGSAIARDAPGVVVQPGPILPYASDYPSGRVAQPSEQNLGFGKGILPFSSRHGRGVGITAPYSSEPYGNPWKSTFRNFFQVQYEGRGKHVGQIVRVARGNKLFSPPIIGQTKRRSRGVGNNRNKKGR